MSPRYFHCLLLLFVISHLNTAASFAATIPTTSLPNHPLNLAELLDIALENHPSTRQTWWNSRRAAASVGSAQSAYYPQIGLEGNASHGRDFKFINGPDTTYTIFGADLYLTMLLYDYGARSATVEAAKKSLVAAGWQTDSTIQKVMANVLENAYATLHAQEVMQASSLSLQEADKVFRAAKELNRTGLAPISDVYTAQANLHQMKMTLAQHKAQLDIHKGKMASILGFSADIPIELAPIEQINAPKNENINTLIAIAMRQRADLMVMQARTAESYDKQKIAKAAYGPKISFNSRGGFNHAVEDKANGGQYRIALNFDMPLFTGFNTTYQNRIAYADTQIAMDQLAELQLNIALEVLTASRTLQAAQEMLPDADQNLVYALKAYDSVLTKYNAGKERITDISYALEELARARVLYSDIKTRWLVSIANLAYATGTLNAQMESSCD